MSRKHVTSPFVLTPIGMSSSSFSDVSDISQMDGAGYQLTWSGGNAGAATVLVQCQIADPTVGVSNTWCNLDMDPIVISGASGGIFLNLQVTLAQKIRLSYVNSTYSQGTLKDVVLLKTIGA